MAIIVHAIYEGGVFRPTEAVEIPENSEVEVEVRLVKDGPHPPSLDGVYAILGERFDSGPDVPDHCHAPAEAASLVIQDTRISLERQSSQFSLRRPGTFSKSRRLAVSRSASLTIAVAAIFRSIAPSRGHCARRRSNSPATASSKGTISNSW